MAVCRGQSVHKYEVTCNSMAIETLVILFCAGLFAGAVSALAGGSTIITFPVLLASGLPPIVANATNFLTALPSNAGATMAYRDELAKHKAVIWRLALISLFGGGFGCFLLLIISNDVFSSLIPWLLLAATLLLAFGKQIQTAIADKLQPKTKANTTELGIGQIFVIFAISVYGGFYGGGLGIAMLAGMTLIGFNQYHTANALKNLTNATIGVLGVVIYAISGLISWPHALVLMAGSSIGGYTAVKIAKHLPQIWLTRAIILLGFSFSIYYFLAN